ncbi:MAG: PIG-L family deacetylase [Acidobacteria bacterium]|nr:PIG-L family deacetylase [Acidobacteriota bacterium]MCA1639110.1 PIG-L family deacetylase [Acidobacteriota bacterium]
MRLPLKRYTAFFWLFFLVGFNFPATNAQVRPVYDLGASGLAQKIKRLQTTASAMHTGAHPDDEDSGLLAYLARREQARTAYLSLNRGEGGQNVIGQELFEPLGVIRSEELLQARRLDGGQQLFTRVMDYGFSKKREEAARIWNEKAVLADMVRAIRLFRPVVVISRFSGTPADGHGQHQFAGYLTPIAFKAAADPQQFPEQIQEGLRPWQAKKLYVSQSFVPNAQNVPTLTVNTGEYDALLGRSYFEIAMEGRSQHKSQEMGSLELRGRQTSGVRLLESNAAKVEIEKSIFDGIDTSITGIPKLVGLTDSFIDSELGAVQSAASKALTGFDALNQGKVIQPLADGLREIRKARREIAKRAGREQTIALADANFLLEQKEREFSEALQAAAGVFVDALSNTETIVASDSTNVAIRVFAPEGTIVKVNSAMIRVPQGWTANNAPEPLPAPNQGFRPRNESALKAYFFTLSTPANASLTQPYWLKSPRQNYTFNWSDSDVEKNMPFKSSLATAEVKINIGGEEVTILKPIQYRHADDIRGELRRDLNIVPMVGISLDSNLLIAPASPKAQRQRVIMSVTNNAPRETKGTATLNLPSGWRAIPSSADFDLEQKGEKTTIAFDVTIPANAKPDSYEISANAVVGNQTFNQMMQEITYPHIQTHRRYQPAEVSAKVVNLKVAPVRVGYIMGTGDQVPEAIRRIGLSVTMLEEKDLSTGDLSKFDTIVVGIRASQVRPDFVANNNRLLDFVKNGGTLIVQYQQQEYIRENLPPFPAKMDMVTNGAQRISNVRVVDENAPVKILAPMHPVFNYPNKINNNDFANWVQERNLYNFSTFDPRYTPLLESHDAGEPESNGGMIYAKIGKGNYIYNSYSFFRQLPNGVTGAYRIFANLLSLPKAPQK